MGFWDWLTGSKPPTEQRAIRERPATTALDFPILSGAGAIVTPETALASTAVLAAIRVLSESVAQLPLIVYRRDGRSKERATDHPLYSVLHDVANPELTAFGCRRLLVQWLAQYGNAFAEIEWSPAGEVVALWPMHPAHVGIERDALTKALYYTYYSMTRQKGEVFPAWRILHLRWLDSDGLVGQSPLRLASKAVGLALDMQDYAVQYFRNGARPSVILRHPAVLGKDAYERLRESFTQNWQGMSNAHRVQVVEEGIDVTTVGVAPEEAQLLDARRWQIAEIARMFRVPPHLIGDLERSTYSNIEHQSQEFLTFTLAPLLIYIEQEIRRQLMTAAERREYEVEHLINGLLRADSQTRYDTYVKAINNGILSVNEAREFENLNPVPEGDGYYMPLNLGLLGDPQPDTLPPDDNSNDTPDNPDASADAAARSQPDITGAWLGDIKRRLRARIANDVRQAGAKALRNGGRAALSEWGEGQQVDWRHAGEEMLAPLTATGASVSADVAAWVASGYQAAVRELIA